MVEELIKLNASGSVAGFLASLCVLATVNFAAKIGIFFWNLKKEKDKLSDSSIQKLTEALAVYTVSQEKTAKQIEQLIAEMPKLKVDLRRAFIALRLVAGDRWPEIRKEMMAEHDL